MTANRTERRAHATPPLNDADLEQRIAERVDQDLKQCFDNAAEGLHWVGPDGTILWANQTELSMLGYSPDEYIGHNISEFHVEQPVIEDILARLKRGETLLNYEARLRCRDGSIRQVLINSNVLWRNDEFLHTRCFTRDVTDRNLSDQIVRQLADIVENSDDAIVGQDLNGTITSWNAAAHRMYGYSAAEAVGQPTRLIIPAGRDAEAAAVIARISNGERVAPFDTIRRHRSGATVDIALTVSPIRNPEGEVVGASTTARDISSRKRLEARDHFLIELDDQVRPLTDAEAITFTAAKALGEHLGVNRCAYATVEADEDTFVLTGNYTKGVESIVGRYTFTQFGEECLRLMRAGEPYVVSDSETDSRLTAIEQPSYRMTAIRSVICVPILKLGRFVAAMAVHCAGTRDWEPDEVELVQHVASRCWESIERARVARELRESEHLFRALANSIANLAWMARPDGWIYWFNTQWYSFTGTTPADMEGWGWERVHDPAILPTVKERWQQSIDSGTPFEMVFPLRGADGKFRRFLTRVNAVRDSRGNVVHWFGTNTDVEDERQATEANAELRKRERLAREDAELQKRVLHSLFMQAPTLIAVLRGPEHIVDLANPPVCLVWGRTEAQLVGQSLFDAMPELREQVFRRLLDDVYRTGVPHVGTETPARIVRADGTTVTVYFNFVYSPFRNVAGAIDGIFVIASDVTQQVLARLQVDDLRRAAEDANRAKDEFLAMLGHELRNPLSPILTALQLMKLRGSDGSEHERTVIERQVNHLTRLVDDLLDVSRIARGKVELKEQLVDIAEVIAQAIETTSPLIEQRFQTLDVNVHKQALTVTGDPARLNQVISNLLNNASKYTPPGGRITVIAQDDAGDVVVRVRDNGIGMAPDVLTRVFDLFVQDRQAIDRSQGGLGLGLTIVRNLVERHGGTVAAFSDGPGAGSEFVVRLPKAMQAAPGRSAAKPDVKPIARPAPGAARILIVDDNEDGAEMLAAALTAKGYDTRVAHDAPDALQIAAAFRPRVAFLDIGLPVMDGYELAARLRELPGTPPPTLVALTGYGQDSDRKKTRAAGFLRHFVKPVNLDALNAFLAAELGADKAEQ